LVLRSLDQITMHKGHKDFKTVVSDINTGKLLEIIESHSSIEIIEVLIQQPIEVREAVVEVSVDMWGWFKKVIQEVFPNAVIVFATLLPAEVANAAPLSAALAKES